jgi:arsenite methyltransferase
VRDKVLELLTDKPDEPDWSRGYLDLIGDEPVPSTGAIQSLWLGPIGTALYANALPFWSRLTDEYRTSLDLLEAVDGSVVLDVGCGPGTLTAQLGERVRPTGLVVGVDVSEPMLTRAATTAVGDNVAYVRADAEHPPFQDESFDAVFSSLALQLFQDPAAAIDELLRVLRPGGQLVIYTPCRGRGPFRIASELLSSIGGVRMFDPRELPAALKVRGVTDVRQRVGGLFQLVDAHKPPTPSVL